MIRVEGIDQLNFTVQRVADNLQKGCEVATLKQARLLKSRIESKINRGPTGNLKSAVIAKLVSKRGQNPVIAIAGIDRRKAPHAWLVEFGGHDIRYPSASKSYTGRKSQRAKALKTPWGFKAWVRPMRAHPYLRPAIIESADIIKREIIDACRASLNETLEKAI